MTPGLHGTDFPPKLQIVRERKSKKAIMDMFFKCFDIHSRICFHVWMLSNSQPLRRSCLEPSASSTWKMLANAMRNWPPMIIIPSRWPVSCLITTPVSCVQVPCLDYTAMDLHTHVRRLECPPLPCPPEKLVLHDLVWVTFFASLTVSKRSYLSAIQMTRRVNKCSLFSLENT